jgi:hypothetical protein
MWKSINFQKGSIAKFHLLNRHGNPSILMNSFSLSLSCKPVEYEFSVRWKLPFFGAMHSSIMTSKCTHARNHTRNKRKIKSPNR